MQAVRTTVHEWMSLVERLWFHGGPGPGRRTVDRRYRTAIGSMLALLVGCSGPGVAGPAVHGGETAPAEPGGDGVPAHTERVAAQATSTTTPTARAAAAPCEWSAAVQGIRLGLCLTKRLRLDEEL